MQVEHLVALLCTEKKCSKEEALQVVELLEVPPEKPYDTYRMNKEALRLWEVVFGHSSRNFGLSTIEFEQMVGALRLGDQTLFERIFLNHFQSCMRFLMHQKHHQQHIAYDATMETLLKFRQMLLDNKANYGNLRYLFTRIAVFAAQKMVNRTDKTTTLEFLDNQPEETPHIDQETLDILSAALRKISDECQRIIKLLYYDQGSWKMVATALEIREDNARKKGQRCREALLQEFNKMI